MAISFIVSISVNKTCATSSSIYTGSTCSPLRKTCFGQFFRHCVTCNNCFSDKESSDGAILLLYLLFTCEPSSFLPPIRNKREIYVKEKIHFLPIPGAHLWKNISSCKIRAKWSYPGQPCMWVSLYLPTFSVSGMNWKVLWWIITVTTWMLARSCCNNCALVWEHCSRLKNRGIPVPAAQKCVVWLPSPGTSELFKCLNNICP